MRCLLAAALCLLVVSPAFADLRKLDPAARIALHRLRAGEQAQTIAAGGLLSVSPQGELDVFVVGQVTREQLEAAGARVRTALPGVFTAWVPVERIEALAALAGVRQIQGAQIDRLTNDLGTNASGGSLFRGAGPGFEGINGAGVIVGGVDTGVDYDHEDFKRPNGTTRILKFWDQTNPLGPPPAGFTYGTEWTAAQIDDLTSTAGDTHGHGTHTMGTAAGDGSKTALGSAPAFTYAGMAPKADIIVVDGSVGGGFSRTQMLDAASYIFGQAAVLGKPCVVNMSIGSQFGPKDGTDAFELGIDALSGPGKVVVMSAGNDRGRALHAEVFAAGAGTDVTMSISGAASNRTVIINGYYEASENINVRITTPGGTVVGPVTLGGVSGARPGVATPNGDVYVENGLSLTSTGDRQVYIELTWAAAGAGVGTWTFTFIPVALGAANGEVDLWRTFFNTTTADFVIGNDPTTEIISAIATSAKSVAAGAWVTRQFWTDCAGTPLINFGGSQPEGNIAPFSSPGPTRDGRMKPDVAGPGTAIASSKSADVTAVCLSPDADLPGLVHTMGQGTSMSAPHVTGAVALLFQKYGALTPTQVQAHLHARAVVDGFVTAFGPVPNKDFGWGKLHVGDLSDPFCTVTSPNGGETLIEGTATTLTWSASDPYLGVTGVDIELSRNGGATWESLASGVANSGSHDWTVALPATSNALLRVTARDAAGNQGVDQSDAVFSIASAVAVTASLFRAEPAPEGVRLFWEFPDLSWFARVAVERAPDPAGPWSEPELEVAHQGAVSVALDRTVESGRTYFYRLAITTRDGRREVSTWLAATAGRPLTEFALERIVPNPTTGRTVIEYAVPRPAEVSVALYDLQGREVAVLAAGAHAPGRYQVTWSGQVAGRAATAGVYFVRLRGPEGARVRRLAVGR